MSTAMVLPRFSELFKDAGPDHESLILPPLRTFPESFSRDSNSFSRHYDVSGRNLLIHDFPSNTTSSCDHSFANHSSSSRETSPSDESSDQDEVSHEKPSSLQTILLKSPTQKEKLPLSGQSKPKKVKYHFCQICQKPFPRPSGLRAHMNMHTKEKPFECGFPGCSKRFSVSSNAKRHLRTHGVGLSPSDEPAPLPYVVDFEEPVVVAMDCDDTSAPAAEPLSLRWMPPGAGSRRSARAQSRAEMS
ncbi:hypothetical protein P691DRAFT_735357 [Macrolepiota fuliginosa MF-IS2]|uniref:C2H2-type domain-containing protein n=1 Tax=Macrolepiota fuliginosa MF-IS2 TaxID=1400762 RepID=A0A9P5X8S8_9AGAR|nr:hypothetical protein P691DRAFT_735357 [Macrolepiota fuliginosa MF-IS2]